MTQDTATLELELEITEENTKGDDPEVNATDTGSEIPVLDVVTTDVEITEEDEEILDLDGKSIEAIELDCIRGTQGNSDFYLSTVPYPVICKLLNTDYLDNTPDKRAQRIITGSRVKKMAEYLLGQKILTKTQKKKGATYSQPNHDIVIPTLTILIDGELEFEGSLLGKLTIGEGSNFLISDGQHRVSGITQALREYPELKGSVGVQILKYKGLEHAQKVFKDINSNAKAVSKSLTILYDTGNPMTSILKKALAKNKVLNRLVEKERATITQTSSYIWTISAMSVGFKILLNAMMKNAGIPDEVSLEDCNAKQISAIVSEYAKTLNLIQEQPKLIGWHGQYDAIEMRQNRIDCSQVGTQGIFSFLAEYPEEIPERVKLLNDIDWARENEQWEGVCLADGTLQKYPKFVKNIHHLLNTQLDNERYQAKLKAEKEKSEAEAKAKEEAKAEKERIKAEKAKTKTAKTKTTSKAKVA